MDQAAKAFLDAVSEEITSIYSKESKRISELKNKSKLQAGIMNYLRVAWRKGKFNGADGKVHIDVYEPFSWSDSSYKMEADSYIEELSDKQLTEEFFPALCEFVDELYLSDKLGPRFFDYRFEIVFEFERESSKLILNRQMVHETKLSELRKSFEQFVHTKILSDPPILPGDRDMFFFAHHLVNPDLTKQVPEEIDPWIRRLSAKLDSNPNRKMEWTRHYTSAFKSWAQDYFLPKHFTLTDEFGSEWILKEGTNPPSADAGELDFFLYVALQVGITEPDTRQKYLELAGQLGSRQAVDYLKSGSGKFASSYRGNRMEAGNNDVTQTIDIRILSEEEGAYGEALDYIINLLQQGFPKSYALKLKTSQKKFLPIKNLAKSKLHQFFANALDYPALFPKLAMYAEIAMEEFAWYRDVVPGEKSVMPGTYAVMGLGLYSESYFPLFQRYMELVDTEHQMVQDGYAEAFIEAHGFQAEHMPVFVSILMGGSDEGRHVKKATIDRPELAEALAKALKDKKGYERELVLCRVFGSRNKLAGAIRKAEPQLQQGLEQLLALWS